MLGGGDPPDDLIFFFSYFTPKVEATLVELGGAGKRERTVDQSEED